MANTSFKKLYASLYGARPHRHKPSDILSSGMLPLIKRYNKS